MKKILSSLVLVGIGAIASILGISSIKPVQTNAEEIHVHDFDPFWTVSENFHYHKCLNPNCDVESSDLPSHGSDGFRYSQHIDNNLDGVCDVCNYTYKPDDATFIYDKIAGQNTTVWFKYVPSADGLNDFETLMIGGLGLMHDYKEAPDLDDYERQQYRKACSDLTKVEKIVVCDGVTSIGNYAFYLFESVTEVSFPKTLKKIGTYSFYRTGLTNVEIPDSVTEYGQYAFASCTSLTDLKLSKNAYILSDGLLNQCGLETVNIPFGVTTLKDGSVTPRSLKNLTIPESVTSIAENAFRFTSLEKLILLNGDIPITIPTRSSNIGRNLEFTVPTDAVNKFAHWFLDNEIKIESRNVYGANFVYRNEIKHVSVEASPCYQQVTHFNWSTETIDNLTPEPLEINVSTVADTTYNLTSLVATYGGTTIDILNSKKFTMPAENVVISGTSKYETHRFSKDWAIAEQGHYHPCTDPDCTVTAEQIVAGGDPGFAFAQHSDLDGDGLCDVCGYFPKPADAQYIVNPTTLLPSTTWYKFDSISGQLMIGGLGDTPDFKGSSNPPWFNLDYTSIVVNEGVTGLGICCFYFGEFNTVSLPNSLKKIGDSVFSNCHYVDEIVIPDSVTEMGDDVFLQNSAKKITLSKNLTSISSMLLNRCYNLEELEIPEGVIYIGLNAFAGCSKLKKITFPSTLTTWDTNNISYDIDTLVFKGDVPQLLYTKKVNTIICNIDYKENFRLRIISSQLIVDNPSIVLISKMFILPEKIEHTTITPSIDSITVTTIDFGTGIETYDFEPATVLVNVDVEKGYELSKLTYEYHERYGFYDIHTVDITEDKSFITPEDGYTSVKLSCETKVHIHTFGEPSYEFNEETHEWTGRTTCEVCGDIYEETTEGIDVKDTDANCEHNETYHVESNFTYSGFEKQTTGTSSHEVEGTALGHELHKDMAQYTWTGNKCKAYIFCNRIGCGHTEIEEVTGSYVKDTDATCFANEKGHYKAVFVNDLFTTQNTAKNSVEVENTKLSHDYVLVPGQESTTTIYGFKDCYKCIHCSNYFEEKTADTIIGNQAAYEAWKKAAGRLDLHVHTMALQNGKNPTCSAPGYKPCYLCLACNKYYEDLDGTILIENLNTWRVSGRGYLSPTGHHYVASYKWVGNVCTATATCDNDGCDETIQEIATGKFVVDTSSTCTTNNFGHYEATFINITYFTPQSTAKNTVEEQGTKLGHNLEVVAGQKETCLADGYKLCYKCIRCGLYFEDYECKIEIGNLQDYQAWKTGLGRIVKHAHTTKLIDGKDPTCLTAGHKEYYQCSECKRFFEDALATKLIVDLNEWKTTGDGRLEPLGHDFSSEVVYTWYKDECTALATCTHEGCNETLTETVTGEYVMDSPATCTTNEKGHYVATFSVPEFEEQQTRINSVEIKGTATGHHFSGEITYTWDGDKCTATWHCDHEGCNQVQTETVTAQYIQDVKPTCTTDAESHYVAAFSLPDFGTVVTEQKKEEGSALGHKTHAVYSWNADYTACTATIMCSNCDFKASESAVVTYADGFAVATFTNPLFETQREKYDPPVKEEMSTTTKGLIVGGSIVGAGAIGFVIFRIVRKRKLPRA